MESAAVLRSFNCSVGAVSHLRSVPEKTGMVAVNKRFSFPLKQERMVVSCVKTTETTATKSDVRSDSQPKATLKNSLPRATFPSGFESLALEICDETEIAEVKLKVGDFEMHLKRNIGATKASEPVLSPIEPPPIPSKPMIESASSTAPPAPPKPSKDKVSPFTNLSAEKSAKLAALEASGASGYVLVASPTVGTFRRGRTFKGKKQPHICKEGDLIKEGQTIGFLDQFGTELPVKSDVAGEILKILFNDGEAVGYGDPLVAVLPSFHGLLQ